MSNRTAPRKAVISAWRSIMRLAVSSSIPFSRTKSSASLAAGEKRRTPGRVRSVRRESPSQPNCFLVAPVFRICSAQSIGETMPEFHSIDRALIDLRDKRTDLSIQISLLKDSEDPNIGELIGLEHRLELLDQRISAHRAA